MILINNIRVKGAIEMRTLVMMSFIFSFYMATPVLAQTPTPKVVTDMVAEAKKQVTRIDMEKFKKVLDREKHLNIIDVREPNEFLTGHIPGAVNIPRGVIEFKIWPYVGYPDNTELNKRFYLYCKTGGRCSLAAKSLQELGFTNLIVVDMKFADWVSAGYPVTEE